MAPRKPASGTTSRNEARGRVDFELQTDEDALTVHLDRQGFRRLLQTLEQLAETGGQQVFERSGHRRGRRNSKAAGSTPPTKLVFQVNEKPSS